MSTERKLMMNRRQVLAAAGAAAAMTAPWVRKAGAAGLEKFKLCSWSPRLAEEGNIFVSEEKGFFKEQGLEIEWVPGAGSGVALKNMIAGPGDIAFVGPEAMLLAADKGVRIDYQVGELDALGYRPEQFDAIALIYAHFPAEIKSAMHRALAKLLKPGGYIIFEAFSKSHLRYALDNEKVGGPKEIGQLFSTEEIAADFSGFEVMELVEQEVELSEGLFHNGTGSVVRFFGRKR